MFTSLFIPLYEKKAVFIINHSFNNLTNYNYNVIIEENRTQYGTGETRLRRCAMPRLGTGFIDFIKCVCTVAAEYMPPVENGHFYGRGSIALPEESGNEKEASREKRRNGQAG